MRAYIDTGLPDGNQPHRLILEPETDRDRLTRGPAAQPLEDETMAIQFGGEKLTARQYAQRFLSRCLGDLLLWHETVDTDDMTEREMEAVSEQMAKLVQRARRLCGDQARR